MKNKKKKEGKVIDVAIKDVVEPGMCQFMGASIVRMLPHAIDGLKPVQRKILWSMYYTKVFQFDKCSSIVGDVAKFLTTGDDSVYPALTKMAQTFRNQHMPIEMYGNQGYITDNKEPAAKRYTEAKLSEYGLDLYFDEDIKFGDYVDNYNERYREPTILPTVLPMSLIMGGKGTATGYTNQILPHSLESVAKCYIEFIKCMNGKSKWDKFDKFIEDNIHLGIPNKSKLINRDAVARGLLTSSAKLTMDGRMKVVESSYGRKAIVITELPFELSVVDFIESLKCKESIELFSEVNDYSSKDGINIEIILKKATSVAKAEELIYTKTRFRMKYNYTMNFVLKDIDGCEALVKRLTIHEIFKLHYFYKRETLKRFLSDKKNSLEYKYDCLVASDLIFSNPKNKKKFFKILEESTKKNVVRNILKAFNIKASTVDYVLNRNMWNLVHNSEEIKIELSNIQKELDIVMSDLDNIDDYLVRKIKNIVKKYK